jgi:hypothetical protein
MRPLIHLATRYASQFGLLGAMAAQVAQALREGGCEVEDGEEKTGGDRRATQEETRYGVAGYPSAGAARGCVRVFFNHPASFEDLRVWANEGAARGVGVGLERDGLVQVFVDHPLALDPGVMDRLAGMENFRLLMVSTDDAALLRLRWPRLQFGRMLHGVPASALVDEATIEGSHAADGRAGERSFDVVIAGGICGVDELARLWHAVPESLRHAGREAVVLMMAGVPFVQASEACMPGFLRASDSWRLMQVMHRACVAAVNRLRRIEMVGALRGVRVGDRLARVVVLGSAAWRDECGENVEYGGEIAYAALPSAFARAKVCVALGPTQFSTAFSERLLLGMAAGCACVAESRLMVRAVLGGGKGGGVCGFDEGNVGQMRAMVEAMLNDERGRVERGIWGAREVAAKHLWAHRVREIVEAGRINGKAAA